MFSVPFSSEEFFGVFTAYNGAIWPAQIPLLLVAVAAVALAALRGERRAPWVWGILAGLWLWTGVVYHLLHFTSINPAAVLFGGLFVFQAGLFLWRGAVRGGLPFAPTWDARGVMGGAMVGYALVVYPLLGHLLGHAWFSSPTFGAPCPVVIFTFGLLLWVPRLPAWLLVVPVAWAVLGLSAVFTFGVLQDAGLLISAVVTLALVLRDRRRQGLPSAAAEERMGAEG